MSGPGGVPSPRAILRGHKSQIHAAVFIRNNERLLTGDADGFVVAWDLGIMRPRAVWKPHEKPILGLSGWDDDKVITIATEEITSSSRGSSTLKARPI
jgi:WD40 repeat protein